MPLESGSSLLHYRLVDKLGEGGMGVVWRALDATLDREVAIKVLPDALAADRERLARFSWSPNGHHGSTLSVSGAFIILLLRRFIAVRYSMLERYGWNRAIAPALVVLAVFMFSSCSKEEPEPESETAATPEMVENVEELEAEIRRVKEEEGEAAACRAVEEAEEMIFMATEVAWLHRNPGPELRPAYQKAVAEGTPMTEVFDYEAGEATVPKRYEEWDAHEERMVELKSEMESSVGGEHRARSLEAICAISETNPHGFALVSETLDDLAGEMSCGS